MMRNVNCLRCRFRHEDNLTITIKANVPAAELGLCGGGAR